MIGDFASASRCPTPLFDLSASLCTAALAMGRGAEDVAADLRGLRPDGWVGSVKQP